MTSICPRCEKTVFFEKVSSLGKNWHRFCLKCERCSKILSPGGHAEKITDLTLKPQALVLAEKVMSLGRNWHRPCLRCVRCKKTLTPGGHAEHEGSPYCHVPCYGYLFGPKGVNIGKVGCYIYEQENGENEIASER
ncbi:hypothetical protein DNTS_027327 [Danionella cerebrum]|uniref:LIM zinc-binding domain-containing protein n=1 Tax=Danionella cerebrum TaxID=2873325 RepID=A0A553QVW8_9TELE|nr:hypothetical protein DNTS_027327 [Danionella translucida]